MELYRKLDFFTEGARRVRRFARMNNTTYDEQCYRSVNHYMGVLKGGIEFTDDPFEKIMPWHKYVGVNIADAKDILYWYEAPGDQAGLRPYLFDICAPDDQLRSCRIPSQLAVREHLYYARAILCYQVAKSCLTGRAGDVYTVGMLLVPYVEEVLRM